MPMVCAREVFDERPRKRSSPGEAKEAPATLWADVPADILGTVLRLLPCLADRAGVRSVCRHWRAAARVQALPAPLPVLVLPRFRFSCLTSDGALTAARHGPMPVELAGDGVRVVGSCDDWLVAVRPSSSSRSRDVNRETDGECFLVNAFSSEVVHLPRLLSSCPVRSSFLGTRRRKPGPGLLHHRIHRAILSAPPSSGSKYIVAALSYSSAAGFRGLALWQPGMTSWYLDGRGGISVFSDNLAFYQGKLYVFCTTRPETIAFELREDVKHGVSLSCPKEYTIDPHPLMPFHPFCWMRCNMVAWRGKLLLIMRFFNRYTYQMLYKPHSVEVFALDLSTSPCGFTQVQNFDGDCIFVNTYVCRSFSPGLHVEVQGDVIYFSDEATRNRFPYVYHMRDGTVRRFDAGLPLADSRVPEEERYIGLPIWIFPP